MSNTTERRRIFILGLDGATFNVLWPLVDRGDLPHFRRLKERGVFAPLASTFSAVTAPAWISFMTGNNPGMHGVFDFVKPPDRQGIERPYNYRSIRTACLWTMLKEEGLKVGVLNMPMTYPAPEVDGVLVAGMGSPMKSDPFTHPRGLIRELESKLGPYQIDVPLEAYGPGDELPFMDDLIRCTETRMKYARELWKRSWDVFMLVFVGMDRIGHKLWEYYDPAFPEPANEKGREVRQRVLQYLEMLDDALGEIDELIGEDGTLYVMSDHGFGPHGGEISVNHWLRRRGLLNWNSAKVLFRKTAKAILSYRKKLKPRQNQEQIEAMVAQAAGRSGRAPRFDPIVWEKTRAFSSSRTCQGVFVNLKGRNAKGIVEPGEEYEQVRDEIIEGLSDLPHPVTGKPMKCVVKRREEVYSGPNIELCPDVVFLFEDGEIIGNHFVEGAYYTSPDWKIGTGMHRIDGVFVARGPDIRSDGELDRARIIDLVPTLLHHLGLAVPDNLDGDVMENIFTEAFRNEHPIRTRPPFKDPPRDPDDDVYSGEDEERIREQLRGIGYID